MSPERSSQSDKSDITSPSSRVNPNGWIARPPLYLLPLFVLTCGGTSWYCEKSIQEGGCDQIIRGYNSLAKDVRGRALVTLDRDKIFQYEARELRKLNEAHIELCAPIGRRKNKYVSLEDSPNSQ